MSRDAIIAAAEALFARHGFDGTSIADVADAVGIRKSSIYSHFNNKAELYLRIQSMIHQQAFASIDEVFADARLRSDEKLREALHRLATHDAISFFRFSMFPPVELADRIRPIFDSFDSRFRERVREALMSPELGLNPSQALHAVDMYIYLMNGLMSIQHREDPGEFRQDVDEAFNSYRDWVTFVSRGSAG